MVTRRLFITSMGLAVTAVASGCAGGAASQTAGDDATVGDDAITMAISPWIGYGPWYIAEAKGYFGDLSVRLQNFNDYSAELAAITSGKVDAVSFPVNAVLQNFDALPVTATLLLDSSTKADAILAGSGVTSVAGLRGKRVAVEKGTTSELLLNAALKSAGMTVNDITVVPTPSDQSAGVLTSGNVDAAVTYEPYVTTARQAGKATAIYTADEDPGLISDALYVQTKVISGRPEVSVGLAKAWQAAVAEYARDPKAGQAIIAKAIGADPDSLTSAFAGVKFYDLADNSAQLGSTFQQDVLPEIADVMVRAGMITAVPDLTGAVDTTGVQQASGGS